MLLPTFTLLVIAVLLFAYVFTVRPWHTEWGATHLDRVAKLPGDELSPRAYHAITHAVNIQAPPEAIWPWIVQLGQDRGGFYSYTFLENLAGCVMPSVRKIVPEWQNRAAGDTVWFATPKRYGGRARMVAAMVEPQRSLTLASPADWKRFQSGDEGQDHTWSFVLIPKAGGTTRMIARVRGVAYPSLATRIVNYLFWEPAHFLMERKMLLTIQALAEKQATQTQSGRAG